MHDVELSTARISAEFHEAIRAHGGEVIERHDNGQQLYLRSVATLVDEVRPQDRVRGGVALQMVAPEIIVAPYLLREVCSNGSVAAHAVTTWRIRYIDHPSEEVIIEELRKAVQACSQPAIFQEEIEKIRVAAQKRAEARRAAIERQRAAVVEHARARRVEIAEIITVVEEHVLAGRKEIARRLAFARERAANDDTRPEAIEELRAALTRDISRQRGILRRLALLERQIHRGPERQHQSGVNHAKVNAKLAALREETAQMTAQARGLPAESPTFIRKVQRAFAPTPDLVRELHATIETMPEPVRRRILKRFSESPDRSRFWLMNAVTSVARDTSDPELKWNLEVLGGAIGAGVVDERSLGVSRDSIPRARIIRHACRIPDWQQQMQKAKDEEVSQAVPVSS